MGRISQFVNTPFYNAYVQLSIHRKKSVTCPQEDCKKSLFSVKTAVRHFKTHLNPVNPVDQIALENVIREELNIEPVDQENIGENEVKVVNLQIENNAEPEDIFEVKYSYEIANQNSDCESEFNDLEEVESDLDEDFCMDEPQNMELQETTNDIDDFYHNDVTNKRALIPGYSMLDDIQVRTNKTFQVQKNNFLLISNYNMFNL